MAWWGAQVVHQWNPVPSTEVNKVDLLDTLGKVHARAGRVAAAEGAIQVLVELCWEPAPFVLNGGSANVEIYCLAYLHLMYFDGARADFKKRERLLRQLRDEVGDKWVATKRQLLKLR